MPGYHLFWVEAQLLGLNGWSHTASNVNGLANGHAGVKGLARWSQQAVFILAPQKLAVSYQQGGIFIFFQVQVFLANHQLAHDPIIVSASPGTGGYIQVKAADFGCPTVSTAISR
jgi:hypothetical protein